MRVCVYGAGNVELLRWALPERIVLAGMVQFNVVHQGDGHFHAGTTDGLEVQADPTPTLCAPKVYRHSRALIGSASACLTERGRDDQRWTSVVVLVA